MTGRLVGRRVLPQIIVTIVMAITHGLENKTINQKDNVSKYCDSKVDKIAKKKCSRYNERVYLASALRWCFVNCEIVLQ